MKSTFDLKNEPFSIVEKEKGGGTLNYAPTAAYIKKMIFQSVWKVPFQVV